MPEQFMISPAGYIAAISHGSAGPTLDVFRPLIGGTFFTTQSGEIPLTGLAGRQGTLQASVVVGAAGVPRTVAMLADKWPSPTRFMSLILDGNNRPYAVLNIGGVVIAQSVPVGPDLPVGAILNMQLAYDALTPRIVFQVEGVTQGVWAVDLVAPWIPFQPKILLTDNLSVTIKHVQVSNTFEVSTRDVPGTQEESAGSVVQANSLAAGSLTAVWSADAAVAAGSESVGSLTAVWPVAAAVAAGSESVGSLTAVWPVAAGLSSDSAVAADLEVITP